MSEQTDAILQEISELHETIKEHRADPATIDVPKLAEELANYQAEMTPLRRGEVETPVEEDWVGPVGAKVYNPVVKAGKYAGMRAGDLEFVDIFLRKANALTPQAKLPTDELTKALTATGSGTGDELVPTGFAAELWKDIFAASLIASGLPQVPMPTDPFELPLGLGQITFYKGSENTATTATDMATAKSTLTATELVGEVDWSYSLDEDAVIAMLPALRDQIRIDAAEYMDKFVLNADSESGATGNINEDDAAPDSADYWMSAGQNGIRHLWLGDNTSQGVNAGGDALSDTDCLDAIKALGKYAQSVRECRWFCDFSTYIKGFMNLDTVVTVDKYGSQAPVVTGELASYRGIPIIPSVAQSLTEADGKCSTTAGNNTLGQANLVRREMWRVGFRRQMMIEVDKDIQKRQLIMVVSFRIAIGAHGTRSSATHTAGIRNILV